MKSKAFPTKQEAKRSLVTVGRLLYERGLIAATNGNISCKISADTLLATPSGIAKGFMAEDMLVTLRLDGAVLSTNPFLPSSEIKLHLRAYQENPALGAVMHAHPPAATALALTGKTLDEALYAEALVSLGVVPCAPYATPGSKELADSIAPYCTGHNAVLLANHGVVTWGSSLEEALFCMETLEQYAKILHYSGTYTGKAQALSTSQAKKLLALRETPVA